MAELSKSGVILATSLPVVFASYLLLIGVTWWYFVIGVVSFILCDLIFLSSLLIGTMRPFPNNISISNKIIIITGGSSGIGLELAKKFVKANASNIILIARNEERLKEAVTQLNEIKSQQQKVSYLVLDLISNNVKEKIDDLLNTLHHIDILVNSAGFSLPGEFNQLRLQQFKQMIDINYLGSVNITHAITPYMCKQKFGQIVFLSSIAGQLGVYGFSAYSPSKYAIRGFAEVLYQELLPLGIGVSVVFPPDTDTPGLAQENSMKPKITQIISETAGLWKSEDVANVIKEGIESRKFNIGFGSDGFFINALLAGACPPSSTIEFWLQCLLIPFLKIYFLFYQTYFAYVISREYEKNN